MGVNLKFSCSQGCLVFAYTWKCGQRSRCTHAMRARTFVLVAVCVSRKLRPCPSYSGCRDRNNSIHWRSLYKGGGGGTCTTEQCLGAGTHKSVHGTLGPVKHTPTRVQAGAFLRESLACLFSILVSFPLSFCLLTWQSLPVSSRGIWAYAHVPPTSRSLKASGCSRFL